MITENEIIPVVTCLTGAISNTRLYSTDHPQVHRYLERAHDRLQQVLQTHPEITFLIVGDDVVVNHQPLTANAPQLVQFARILKQNAIERLTLLTGVTARELVQLVGDLAAKDQEVIRSTPGIKLGRLKVETSPDSGSPQVLITPEIQEHLKSLAFLQQQSLDDLKEIYHQIKSSREISPLGLDEMVKGFLQGMLRNINPLQMLAALKRTDEYTFTHAINVCILTMAQAESLGIQGSMLREIGIAASLHDAGKMFVPDEILNKPDKLTDEEWQHMRRHSAGGARYILRLQGIPRLAFLAALEHHIRFDGKGYPDLGKGWRPHIVSQMIAIADVFDAMRSRRPYKDAKPDEVVVKILREESGGAFNPRLVDNFLRLIQSGCPLGKVVGGPAVRGSGDLFLQICNPNT